MPSWLFWLVVAVALWAVVCCGVILWRLWPRGEDDDIYGGSFDVPPEAPEDEARRRQV